MWGMHTCIGQLTSHQAVHTWRRLHQRVDMRVPLSLLLLYLPPAISTPAASPSVVPLNGLRLLNVLEVSGLPPAVSAVHSACGAAAESPCISSLISAALSMLRLSLSPSGIRHHFLFPPPLHFPTLLPSFISLYRSLPTPLFTKKKKNPRLKWLRLLRFQSITNQMCLNSQPPAHPGLQRSRLHSALELDGGRPGVHLPDLPPGPLPARAVPAGRAPAVGASPCGGGVLRVAQVLTLHKSLRGPVCEIWLHL